MGTFAMFVAIVIGAIMPVGVSPTASPTESLTASSTESPSAVPTGFLTAAPTRTPAATPTESPTASPAESPSAAPMELPKASSTLSLAPVPTPYPSADGGVYRCLSGVKPKDFSGFNSLLDYQPLVESFQWCCAGALLGIGTVFYLDKDCGGDPKSQRIFVEVPVNVGGLSMWTRFRINSLTRLPLRCIARRKDVLGPVMRELLKKSSFLKITV